MTQQPTPYPIRRGRIFPEHTIPPEELTRQGSALDGFPGLKQLPRQAELEARYQRCRPVFERVRNELIADHYNWFMIIEPNSGDYFIDPDEDVAVQKARQKYPSGWFVTFGINKTGACGMI